MTTEPMFKTIRDSRASAHMPHLETIALTIAKGNRAKAAVLLLNTLKPNAARMGWIASEGMTMNEPEIFNRLIALHSALTAKLGAQPWSSPSLYINSSGKCSITIYRAGPYTSSVAMELHYAAAETISATLADADAFVAAMPDRDAAQKTNWHRKLGDVIDEGHALALPDAVMAPLRAGSQAMTENLLGVAP
jgi:hypothetical protein